MWLTRPRDMRSWIRSFHNVATQKRSILIPVKVCYNLTRFFPSLPSEFDHGNYIYKFIFMQYDMLPWPEAEIYCRDVEEGHLARVRDLQVSKTIEKDLRKIRYYFGFSKMWIGASDLYNEGQFEWTSGGPVEFQHWVQGEPSGRRRGMEEDCVVVTADPHWAHWKDEYCLHHLPFICQTKGERECWVITLGLALLPAVAIPCHIC